MRLPDRTFPAETALLGAAAVPPLDLWGRTDGLERPVRALLRVPPVAAPVAAIMLNALVISLVEFLAPFYLQRTLGLSPFDTAAAILALPVAMAAAGPAGGVLGDRRGRARQPSSERRRASPANSASP